MVKIHLFSQIMSQSTINVMIMITKIRDFGFGVILEHLKENFQWSKMMMVIHIHLLFLQLKFLKMLVKATVAPSLIRVVTDAPPARPM